MNRKRIAISLPASLYLAIKASSESNLRPLHAEIVAALVEKYRESLVKVKPPQPEIIEIIKDGKIVKF